MLNGCAALANIEWRSEGKALLKSVDWSEPVDERITLDSPVEIHRAGVE
jgi:hypothetical protein